MAHPFQPDLLDWARRQHSLAGELCRGCRAYHATFGYRRLSGLIGGVEADQEPLATMLQPLLRVQPDVAVRRVLVAGSADTGITAFMRHLAGAGAARHAWLVADRCETPLAACRAYAQQHGLPLQTLRCDLRELPLEGEADLVVGHSVLGFADATGRAALLQRLARALAPGGRLVLATRFAASGQTTTAQAKDTPDIAERWAGELGHAVTRALQAREVPLPCAAAEFDRLLHECATREQHSSPYRERAELEVELNAAGFEALQWLPGGRGLAFLDDGSIRPGGRPSWVVLAGVRNGR